jgi:hypothetical protein
VLPWHDRGNQSPHELQQHSHSILWRLGGLDDFGKTVELSGHHLDGVPAPEASPQSTVNVDCIDALDQLFDYVVWKHWRDPFERDPPKNTG